MTKFRLTMFFEREDLIKHYEGTDEYETVKKFIEELSDREIKALLDLATTPLKDMLWKNVEHRLKLKIEESQEKASLEKVIYVKMIKNEISGFLLHAILTKEELYSKYFTKDGVLLPDVLD